MLVNEAAGTNFTRAVLTDLWLCLFAETFFIAPFKVTAFGLWHESQVIILSFA